MTRNDRASNSISFHSNASDPRSKPGNVNSVSGSKRSRASITRA